jgi:hypothetical protein
MKAILCPYGQKTEPTAGTSRRLSMVIAQEPAQSLPAPHRPCALPIVCSRKQQDVAQLARTAVNASEVI